MHQISSWISEWLPRSQTSRWPSQCTRKSERRLSMNGERKVRPHPALSPGRGRSVLAHSLFMVPMRVKKTSRLSMNLYRQKGLLSPALSSRGGEGLLLGSWSQCMRKSERRLSMNRDSKRPPLPGPLLPRRRGRRPYRNRRATIGLPRPARNERGEGWGEGLFLGSWSQCMRSRARASSPQPSPPGGAA